MNSTKQETGNTDVFIAFRFVAQLPPGWVFILFCTLLRMTEGAGSAMFFTAVFTLLPEYYPSRVGTVLVNDQNTLLVFIIQFTFSSSVILSLGIF